MQKETGLPALLFLLIFPLFWALSHILGLLSVPYLCRDELKIGGLIEKQNIVRKRLTRRSHYKCTLPELDIQKEHETLQIAGNIRWLQSNSTMQVTISCKNSILSVMQRLCPQSANTIRIQRCKTYWILLAQNVCKIFWKLESIIMVLTYYWGATTNSILLKTISQMPNEYNFFFCCSRWFFF